MQISWSHLKTARIRNLTTRPTGGEVTGCSLVVISCEAPPTRSVSSSGVWRLWWDWTLYRRELPTRSPRHPARRAIGCNVRPGCQFLSLGPLEAHAGSSRTRR